MGPDAVEGQAATVAHQDTGHRVDSLFSGSWTGLPRLVALSPYVLAPEPEFSDFRRHLVSAIHDLFIEPAPMVDHFTSIELVVEKGADGAFGEGPAMTSGVALGVQLLGYGLEGVVSCSDPRRAVSRTGMVSWSGTIRAPRPLGAFSLR